MGLSLRVKMIGATVLMLLFVVALFGALQVRTTTADLNQETARLRQRRLQQAQALGLSAVETLAASAPFLIADNDYNTLRAQLGSVVRAVSQSDLRTDDAFVTDDEGRVLAYASRHEGRAGDARLPLEGLQGLKGGEARLDGEVEAGGRVVASAPIEDGEGKRWGYVRLVYDLEGLREDLARIEVQAAARRVEIVKRGLVFGALVLLLGVVIAVLEALAIARPVLALTRSAQQIAGGELGARAQIGGRDELGELARSFNYMADRVEALLEETAAKTALERELEVARIIQEAILPPPGLVKAPGLRFAGFLRSASMCGGDFWAHYEMGPGRTLLCVGDVTGHGVPSAMITAACRSGLDTLRSMTGGQIEIEALMQQLNHTIYEAAQRKFTMTFLGLVYEAKERRLALSNAGHNFPLLLRREAQGPRVRPLVVRGTRLGDAPQSRYLSIEEILHPGDLLCLFTDGITEQLNAQGVMFGERRLARVLQGVFERSPEEIVRVVVEAVAEFAGGTPQGDDLTLVIARVEA